MNRSRLPLRHFPLDWCRRRDSNPQSISGLRTSSVCVFQFRHDGISPDGLEPPSLRLEFGRSCPSSCGDFLVPEGFQPPTFPLGRGCSCAELWDCLYSRPGSNRQPLPSEGTARPIELLESEMVFSTGFEPVVSRFVIECYVQFSYENMVRTQGIGPRTSSL